MQSRLQTVSYTHLDVYKRQRYVRQKTEAQKFREDRQQCYRVLSDYYYLLKKWEADNSPRTPEEEPHPRFVEAIQKKTYVEYLLDLFLYESEEEQKAWTVSYTHLRAGILEKLVSAGFLERKKSRKTVQLLPSDRKSVV